MVDEVVDPLYPLEKITVVSLKDGRKRYIKEFFAKEDAMGKETLDVTTVCLVLPQNFDLNNTIAYEDDKSTINVADIVSMTQVTLK